MGLVKMRNNGRLLGRIKKYREKNGEPILRIENLQ